MNRCAGTRTTGFNQPTTIGTATVEEDRSRTGRETRSASHNLANRARTAASRTTSTRTGAANAAEQDVDRPITARASEMVVLVHGLAAGRSVLRPLQWALEREGYATLSWGYRSVLGDIRSHGRSLAKQLESLQNDPSIERITAKWCA